MLFLALFTYGYGQWAMLSFWQLKLGTSREHFTCTWYTPLWLHSGFEHNTEGLTWWVLQSLDHNDWPFPKESGDIFSIQKCLLKLCYLFSIVFQNVDAQITQLYVQYDRQCELMSRLHDGVAALPVILTQLQDLTDVLGMLTVSLWS